MDEPEPFPLTDRFGTHIDGNQLLFMMAVSAQEIPDDVSLDAITYYRFGVLDTLEELLSPPAFTTFTNRCRAEGYIREES